MKIVSKSLPQRSIKNAKLSKVLNCDVSLKCQLPGEDLDALVSIKSDEELHSMLEEYDSLHTKLRVFLFLKPPNPCGIVARVSGSHMKAEMDAIFRSRHKLLNAYFAAYDGGQQRSGRMPSMAMRGGMAWLYGWRKKVYVLAVAVDVWDYAAAHPEYSDLLNEAMACNACIVIKAILSKYEGFQGLNSLVDVGGGIGTTVAAIVKAYPSMNGINYDISRVIATAPQFPGVKHVGGDMFREVPSADAVFMKWIMHDWSDEDCVKILKQCKKAIPERGKVIIVDTVLNAREKTAMDPNFGLVFDLTMIAHSSGGKERSEEEWKNLLVEPGFPRFNVIAIPALQSVIEAFPY